MIHDRKPAGVIRRAGHLSLSFLMCATLVACGTKRLVPYAVETPPLVLLPASQAGIQDKRARFREIFCAVLERRAKEIQDYQPCDEALRQVGVEPEGTGRRVPLTPSTGRLLGAIVPGLGYGCIAQWMKEPDTLSSTQRNAAQIRDTIMAMPQEAVAPRIVLIGLSNGAPDILEALVSFPKLLEHVAAVVTLAGAVGGSPLANDVQQYQADLVRHFPKAQCDAGDRGAVESLRPGTRQAWLAGHPPPQGVRYYSLVALPQPERISAILKPSYNKLSRIDPRNDSKVIVYDQVVPGGTLLGYLNADHYAGGASDRPHLPDCRIVVHHPQCVPAGGTVRSGPALHRRRPAAVGPMTGQSSWLPRSQPKTWAEKSGAGDPSHMGVSSRVRPASRLISTLSGRSV